MVLHVLFMPLGLLFAAFDNAVLIISLAVIVPLLLHPVSVSPVSSGRGYSANDPPCDILPSIVWASNAICPLHMAAVLSKLNYKVNRITYFYVKLTLKNIP